MVTEIVLCWWISTQVDHAVVGHVFVVLRRQRWCEAWQQWVVFTASPTLAHPIPWLSVDVASQGQPWRQRQNYHDCKYEQNLCQLLV